jgi:hypothetical protein
VLCNHPLLQQKRHPLDIAKHAVWAQLSDPRTAAGSAAAANITSLAAPGFNTLLQVLHQHAQVWQEC